MAVSSNYKLYNRQPRALTEETGFSGGMLWTGNNIDSTHLKAIVNFDYDDTTGFLKTRDPLVSTPILDGSSKKITLDPNKGLTLLGTYNLCATQYIDVDGDRTYDNLSTAGWLYLFGQLSRPNNDSIQLCTSIQGVYLSADNVWYNVDCSVINELFQAANEFGSSALAQVGKINLILLDNVLYCTNLSTDRVFTAFRLECDVAEVVEQNVYTLKAQTKASVEGYDWDGYDDLVNQTTLLEATVTGFNAARGTELFTYGSNEHHDGLNNYILGVYLTDPTSGGVIISPRIGQTVNINIAINGYAELEDVNVNVFKLKADSTGDKDESWTFVGYTSANATSCVFPYVFSELNTSLAFTLDGKDNTPQKAYSITAEDSLMPVTYRANDTTNNLKLKAYDLTKARSSCLWNKRLVLWGCDDAANTLFVSEANNFYYFPVPNNVALFETDIISCVPYLGALLVFTADRIYRLSENAEGAFVQEVIQNDMPLAREDASYLRAIKNMVLFKSGNYYYMVVPKAQSLTGELSIAPIYKNIAGFLDNLKDGVCDILNLLYPDYAQTQFDEDVEVSESPEHIYTEQDTVRILYNVECAKHSFMLFLNYNTNLRAWTTYIEETTDFTLAPAALTAARIMSFIRVDAKSSNPNPGIYETHLDPAANNKDSFRSLIDTGYRNLTTAMKKRFREIQVKMYSSSENITAFGSAFLLDGVTRRSYVSLKESIIDESTQTVSLVPDYDLNTFVLEPNMSIDEHGVPAYLSDLMQQTDPAQGSDSIELSDWKLDFSHFKREAPTTIRIPVSGKGYAPRFILMTPNSLPMYINEINWVYRLMYGR